MTILFYNKGIVLVKGGTITTAMAERLCQEPTKQQPYHREENMTSTEKTLIDQYHRQGMGHTEIAAKLNLSVNTVKSYWRRKKAAVSSTSEIETIISTTHAADPATDRQSIDVQPDSSAETIAEGAIVSPAVPDTAAPASPQKKVACDAPTIICKQCGAKASTTRHDKEFCSARCRKQWWHSHRGDSINAADHTCPVCGQHFRTNRKQKPTGAIADI